MSTEKDLIKDLKTAGVNVTSVWDLVNGPNNYNAALPVLIQHFQQVEESW